jgi:predicted CoA-binding protein
LRDAGYTVFAVHPKLETVEGDRCYASIKDLPEIPDVVDLVVPPAASLK